MRRMHKYIRVVAMVVIVLTTESVFAYYNPSTGRWLSRDPIDEPGFQVVHAGTGGFWGSPAPGAQQSSRWITRDSIMEPNDFNVALTLENREQKQGNTQGSGGTDYIFVKNNPISKIDMLGLSERDIQKITDKFVETLRAMCKDCRCRPERGWLQNPIALLPWTKQEGCTSQAVDVYTALYPLIDTGGLDDKWNIEAERHTRIWPIFYHNDVVIRPQGGHDVGLDSITLDSWKGCYTIRHYHIVPIPPSGIVYYTNDRHCFTCKDFKN